MRRVAIAFIIFLVILTISPSVHEVRAFIDVEGFFVGVYTGGDNDHTIDHYTVPPQLYYNILRVFEKGAPVYRVDTTTGNLIYLGNFTQLYNHNINRIQVYESKSGTGPLSADSISVGHDGNRTYYEHFVMFEDLWGGGDLDREDIYAKIRYYPELGKIWYIIRTHGGYAGYKKRLFFYTHGIIIDMGSDDVDNGYHGDDNANYGPFSWHHCMVITDPYSGKSDTWCGNEIKGEFGLIAPPSALWQPVVAVIDPSPLEGTITLYVGQWDGSCGGNYGDDHNEMVACIDQKISSGEYYGKINVSKIDHSNSLGFDSDDEEFFMYYYVEFYVETPGTWWFATDSDDASEVEVDGDVVASWYGGHGICNCQSHSGSKYLSRGWHTLIYRMQEWRGGQLARLWYKAPGQSTWQIFGVSSLKWFLIPRSLEANRTDIEGIISSTFPLSLPPDYIISGFDDVEPDDDLIDEDPDASQPISVEQYGYYTVYRGTSLVNTNRGSSYSWQRLHTDYLMEVQGEIMKNGKRHVKVRIEGHDNPGPDYKRGTSDDRNFEYYIMFYNIVTGEYTDWIGPIRNNSWWGFLEVKKP